MDSACPMSNPFQSLCLNKIFQNQKSMLMLGLPLYNQKLIVILLTLKKYLVESRYIKNMK